MDKKEDIILELKALSKLYPGVAALDHIDLKIRRGEVHALLGENGAGKSTIIKAITGAIRPSSGEIVFNGKPYSELNPIQSGKLGISAIYQELNLMPSLSVADNIFYGRELKKGPFLDKKAMNRETEELLKEFGIHIEPDIAVKNLGVAYQQIVEISKSVAKNLELLIMDEPTATLTNTEIDLMFHLIRRLKEKGLTIIYISHRLPELYEVCDRVTVIRDGKYIATKNMDEVSRPELISLMVGRELGESYPRRETPLADEVVLEAEGLTTAAVQDIGFRLRRGEILGFGGLVGAGRTETGRALFGADKLISGRILVNGREVTIKSPKDAIKQGIGLIPEDRKQQGVILEMSIKDNISYSCLDRISRGGFVNAKKEQKLAQAQGEGLKIKTPSLKKKVRDLSGGNQQKVVLAKWLAVNSDILIFDEPTRGIDVGAKQEIYNLMRELADQGKGIIMISSEMPELIGMSDRIIVLHDGRIAGELDREEAQQSKILALASGE